MPDRPLKERGESEAAQGAALEAFVRFTEATNTVHDPHVLLEQAVALLNAALPAVQVAAYTAAREVWDLVTWRGAFYPEALAAMKRGLPKGEPQLLKQFQQDRALFSEWDADVSLIPEASRYQAVGYYPYRKGGEIYGFFAIGLVERPVWTEREQLVFLALGRALELALERAWHAQERETRVAELERQLHSTRVFAELTQDLTFNDPGALIQETGQLLFRLLPGSSVQVWTREEGEWRVASRVGQPPTVQRWERLPEDPSMPGQRILGGLGNTERREVSVNGQVEHVLDVTLPEARRWTRPDLTVLDTVTEFLGLALERARQARVLLSPSAGVEGRRRAAEEREQAALAAQEETLAFSEAVWHGLRREITRLSRTPDGGEVRERLAYLGAQLDALLAYGEISRRPLQPVLLSLTTLVLSVKTELDRRESRPGVHWTLGDLPTVRADRELLRLALFELLSNALKFTQGREEVWIEVGSRPQEAGGWAVHVRDNGPGFEPSFAGVLFGVFERAQEEVEGLGMGLALVRRIVERHGGQVWAEGRPGEGATFGFTLP